MILAILAGVLLFVEPALVVGLSGADLLVKWQFSTWSVAGLFAVFGVLLLRNAYRRWWLTELDCVET
jgi:undecaprenyl pyrophosphate phosphatase UppP